MDVVYKNLALDVVVLYVAPLPAMSMRVARGAGLTRLEAQFMPSGGISTYRGGNFCGPGWGFTKQDVENGQIMPEAFDVIDAACQRHDQCYADYGYFTERCNVQLASELSAIIKSPKSTPQQRYDAAVMAALFETEAHTLDRAVSAQRTALQSLERYYRELLDSGAQFMFVIEQGILRSAQFPFQN